MVGKVPDLEPNFGIIRHYGHLHIYWSPKFQTFIARSWPKGNGGPTPARIGYQKAFARAVQVIKKASAADRTAAAETARNTPFLERDILMMVACGNLFTATTADGKTLYGWRMANLNIQQLLDSITTTNGAMIIRIAGEWVSLLPGADGYVLTIDPGTHLPVWAVGGGGGGAVDDVTGTDGIDVSPTTGHVSVALASVADGTLLANITGSAAPPVPVTVSDLLDTLGSTDGEILLRMSGVWTAVSSDVFVNSVTGTSGIDASETAGAVTLALSDIADGTILANISGGSAPPIPNTLSDLLDTLGATQGDMIRRTSTGWEVLGVGSSGQVLASSGTDPYWATPGGGGVTTEPSLDRFLVVPAHPGFDPAMIFNASITLASNNKNATPVSSSPYNHAYGTPARYTGKRYFEFVPGSTSFERVGVCGSAGHAVDLDTGSPGNFGSWLPGQIGWQSDGKVIATSWVREGIDTTLATYATWAAGNRLSFAIDLDAGLMWFRVSSGNWNNSGAANPATGAGGLAVPMLWDNASNGLVWPGCNMGNTSTSNMYLLAADFTQTVPSGYTGWAD